MEIAFHLGMHCTDDEALVDCLQANTDALQADGVQVPPPADYRLLLRDTVHKLRGAPASTGTEQMLLDALIADSEARRIVLSWSQFLGIPKKMIGDGMLYPIAGERTLGMRLLFPNHQCSFHLAVRNLATFIPALVLDERTGGYGELMAGSDPLKLSWADMVARIREANPECPVTVWCDEDTPLIWPEVLQAVSDHSPDCRLGHIYDRLDGLMTHAALQKMLDYLEAFPPPDEDHRRKVVAAFLERFMLEEEIEVELDLPGWTDDYAEELSELYEADVARIAAMDGVRLIAP